jgi:hypothetical protein
MTGPIARYWKLAVVWALSLMVVNVVARAQTPQAPPRDIPRHLLEGPVIVSGNDVGFRIERTRDGVPLGKVVVRINGKWVDTATSEPTR